MTPTLKQEIVAWGKVIGKKAAIERLVRHAGICKSVAYLLLQGKYNRTSYLRTQNRIEEEIRKHR